MDNMNVEVESKQQTNVESQSKSEAKKPQEDLISLTDYARELAKHLPKEVFKRDPWRLQYFFYCYAGALGLIYAMYAYDLAWYFKLPMAILAGTLSMGLGFLAHEILHGSVIKSKFWQDVFCFFGLGTFFIGPTYWRYNHNVLHHGNTQLLYKDPDAFPTQGIYKRSKFTRMQFPWTPGSGTFRSFTYFFFFFTFKVFLDHLYFRFAGKMFDNFNKKRAYLEFFACFAIAIPYIYFIGSKDPLFLIVIPYMVQNWTAMSYISTNHNLCPLHENQRSTRKLSHCDK
jgi:fatty acid desaturase